MVQMQMKWKVQHQQHPAMVDYKLDYKFREELVGKRFVSYSGCHPTQEDISKWGWRCGFIRATSHLDNKNEELQVSFTSLSRWTLVPLANHRECLHCPQRLWLWHWPDALAVAT